MIDEVKENVSEQGREVLGSKGAASVKDCTSRDPETSAGQVCWNVVRWNQGS